MIYATSQRTIIIGAGIAGPVVAMFLKKAGFSADIYDENEYPSDMGGPLTIAPNGMHVLNELGLAEKVLVCGSVIEKNTVRNSRGKLLASYMNASAMQFGFPAVSIAREVLHKILTDAAAANGVVIHYNKRLKNITGSYSQCGVTASFEDGTNVRSDILIGADGIDSATRTIALPDGPAPAYTGVVGIGGFTAASLVKNAFDDQRSSITSIGPSGYFGYNLTGSPDKNSIGWWVNLPMQEKIPSDELRDTSLANIKQQLLNIYKGWHEPIESIISNASSIVKRNIFDLLDMPKWYGGRVVLIGDAAHAMIPHAGQGASTAMEDGMYLAKLLRYNRTSTLGQVFEEYQHHRQARVNKITRLARRYGRPERITSDLHLKVRDFFLSSFMNLFGTHANEWMYTYKIDWNSSR